MEKEIHLFATLLRHYRHKSKMTQRQLVYRLRDSGYFVMESAISMWETGRRLPDDSAAIHFMGKALDLTDQEEHDLLATLLVDKMRLILERYTSIAGDEITLELLSKLLESPEENPQQRNTSDTSSAK